MKIKTFLIFISFLIIGRGQAAPDFTFVVYGDPREKPLHGDAIIPLIMRQSPDFVICTGDLVEDPLTQEDWNIFLGQIKPVIDAGIPFFPVYGNHEGKWSVYTALWDSLLSPFKVSNNIKYRDSTCLNYTFEHGNWHFASRSWSENNLTWLKGVLKKADSSGKVSVALEHIPTFAVAYQERCSRLEHLPIHDSTYLPNRVDYVFMGHTHYFYKTEYEGITYIETSGGGAGLRTPRDSCMRAGDIALRQNHITRVDVIGKGAVLTVLDTGGSVLERFVMGDTTEDPTATDMTKLRKDMFGLKCYPNPFNPRTGIFYPLASTQSVKLKVFNPQGHVVFNETGIKQKGANYTVLDFSDMAAGIYFLKLKADGKTTVKKLLLAR